VPFRNPALLAKMCTTLDVVSHGRSIIGLGAGWHEPEFRAYGWPFPPVRERMEMLEEAMQIIDLMLTQRVASSQGTHYVIDQAVNVPGPVQQPRPPIMIGGSGERVTLKLVAKYADMCNLQGGDVASTKLGFDVLRAHCDAVGRPFDEITRSSYRGIMIARDDAELAAKRARFPDYDGIIGTPGEVIAGLKEFADVGCQYVTFDMPDAEDIEPLLLLGETVVPAIAGL
jgi:alkanesulfonate monooxygenase SsuD/methylene tetrahydromethanopterin reductase-like flavin-dependent oxidoreductase (luciferase family)